VTRLGVGAQWVAEADFAAIDLTQIRIGAYSAQVHQESAQDNYVSVYQDGLALCLFRRLVVCGRCSGLRFAKADPVLWRYPIDRFLMVPISIGIRVLK